MNSFVKFRNSYWQKFDRPTHKDSLSTDSFRMQNYFRFCHPKFVYKLKRAFPEMGHPETSNFYNRGSFSLTIEHRFSSFKFDIPKCTLFYRKISIEGLEIQKSLRSSLLQVRNRCRKHLFALNCPI